MEKNLQTDLISPDEAVTLDGLFHARVRRDPDGIAYHYFDDRLNDWCSLTWSQVLLDIVRWQAALIQEGFEPGDRVAIMLKNCPTWVVFDQAALGLGLVTVPLYTSDRPENVAHVLRDSGAKLLLIATAEHWYPLQKACNTLSSLERVVTIRNLPEGEGDTRLRGLNEWLPEKTESQPRHVVSDPDTLATIVYTSGTTGKSKGVMLSHRNLLSTSWGALQTFDIYPSDLFLSFLPLSHCLERLAGYYLPVMAGAAVAYARSFQQLQEDLVHVRPTVLVTVPRIFERIQATLRSKLDKGPRHARWLFDLAVSIGYSRFEHAQGRASWNPGHLLWPLLKLLVANKLMARLGGRLRLSVSGGAALSTDISRTFIGLGLPIIQGYGLTETSPVIGVNRVQDNLPSSIGHAIPGVEVRLGESNALHVRGPNVMLGYWNNPEATRAVMTDDGWLNTGDIAQIDADGHITITGRIKEIIVLNNGEKIPPSDMEAAILKDPLFEQVMIVGEGKPYLSLLAVVNRERWKEAAIAQDLSGNWPTNLELPQARAFALARIAQQMKAFPGYARIRRVALLSEPWTIENGLMTPTLKLKRNLVLDLHRIAYEKLYEGYSQ